MKSGIVIINKETGMTSQNVVSKVKKILNVKKAGHIGTLDPLAEGVLPVLIGDATKMSKYLIEHDKTYIATIQLGIKKDTGDEEGLVIDTAKVGYFDEKIVDNLLKKIQGKQKQAPHQYSAVKINGKKLYEYAREGIEVEIPKREIEIYSATLIQLNQEEKQITFKVSCSKGTYIRVLCEEIAERLGTVGYMKYLNRIQVATFDIKSAVKLDKLTEEDVISVETLCLYYKKIELKDKQIELFLNGVMLTTHVKDGIYRVYNKQRFIGLGIVKDERIKRDLILQDLDEIKSR